MPVYQSTAIAVGAVTDAHTSSWVTCHAVFVQLFILEKISEPLCWHTRLQWSGHISVSNTYEQVVKEFGRKEVDFSRGKLMWHQPVGIMQSAAAVTLMPLFIFCCSVCSGDSQCFSMGWAILQNCPFMWRDLDSHWIHGSLGPPESSPNTAPQSVQLFLQGTSMWPKTDRQTDRPRYVWHLLQQFTFMLCMWCGLKNKNTITNAPFIINQNFHF